MLTRTVDDARREGRATLAVLSTLDAPSAIPPQTVALEVDLLLCEVLRMSDVQLFSSSKRVLTDDELRRFERLLERRANSEPIAYLTGKREFYSRDFTVTPAVLIPRPETELLVDLAMARLFDNGGANVSLPFANVIDIGTGSGAIILAVFAEFCSRVRDRFAELNWVASDLSCEALAVAKVNAETFGCSGEIKFLQGDLLEPVPPEYFEGPTLMLSNPPYIPDGELLPRDVDNFEPQNALRAGPKGLDLIEKLVIQATNRLGKGSLALIEIGEGQALEIESSLKKLPHRFHKDLRGIERVLELSF